MVSHGRLDTDTATLGLLAEAGVHVTLLSGRQGRRLASLTGPYGKDVQRRLDQYRVHLDPAAATAIAHCLVERKLATQQRLLHRALLRRPDLRRPLLRGGDALRDLRARLHGERPGLASLRGVEGAATRAYFEAYRHLFAPSLDFPGRRRRPPPDPVNAALSLGYTLLHTEAVRAIHAAGLDPYLGYLHEPAHGRESLAADLIEPLRAHIDALVWGLFRDKTLEAAHFDHQGEACLLGKAGRGRFFAAYEARSGVCRRWLRRGVHRLIQRLAERPTTAGDPS